MDQSHTFHYEADLSVFVLLREHQQAVNTKSHLAVPYFSESSIQINAMKDIAQPQNIRHSTPQHVLYILWINRHSQIIFFSLHLWRKKEEMFNAA